MDEVSFITNLVNEQIVSTNNSSIDLQSISLLPFDCSKVYKIVYPTFISQNYAVDLVDQVSAVVKDLVDRTVIEVASVFFFCTVIV